MYKYVHGGDIYSEKTTATGKAFVDFSANINPLGVPVGVKKALRQAINSCVNYPDAFCRDLAAATAAYLQVPQQQLFFGNGAADVLFRLALAIKPKEALILAPTFADYEKALASVDCQVAYYYLQEQEGFRITPTILDSITPALDMMVICNPNNPTGELCDKQLLLEIVAKCQEYNIKLLIDECFVDFVDQEEAYSLRSLLGQYKNLIILKAFTKTFAIPGVRLGYCLTGNEELLKSLHQHGQDWSVSVLAQEAGKAALKEQKYLAKSMDLISRQRSYLKKELTKLGAVVYGSKANYIFFKWPHEGNLKEQLHNEGYLIRSCSNYVNLGPEYYRIAVKAPGQNRGLIAAMRKILWAH